MIPGYMYNTAKIKVYERRLHNLNLRIRHRFNQSPITPDVHSKVLGTRFMTSYNTMANFKQNGLVKPLLNNKFTTLNQTDPYGYANKCTLDFISFII